MTVLYVRKLLNGNAEALMEADEHREKKKNDLNGESVKPSHDFDVVLRMKPGKHVSMILSWQKKLPRVLKHR